LLRQPRRRPLALTTAEFTFSDFWPGTAPEIWAEVDGEKLRVVLRNLLENAFKYSLADSRPVEVVVTTDGEVVIVVVTDDGPGLPADDLHNLFEPFFRVDRSRSKKSGGYGLGLSICKRIVEAHGGRRGAEFTITLPDRAKSPCRLWL
jgi:signal transduction histidine kinase